MLETKYRTLPGPVGKLLEGTYSTTASVPLSPTCSLVYTTGHLGLDVETGQLVRDSLEAEFDAIFDCLDAALRHAQVPGGCSEAFKFTCFLTDSACEPLMQEVFKRRWPGHHPTWVATIVREVVGGPGMHGEIAAEAVAYSKV